MARRRAASTALARPAGPAALAFCLGLAGLFAGGMIGFADITPPSAIMPAAAFEHAREAGLKGRVLNHYNYGGYLIRAGIPTFIDGRGELYGGDFIKRYADAVNLRGEEPFETLLERYAHRVDVPAQGPAGQQASGAPARLAAGLQRRHRHDLRARPVASSSAGSTCSGRWRRGGLLRCRAPCPNRACGPPRRSSSRPRRSVRPLSAARSPWPSGGR